MANHPHSRIVADGPERLARAKNRAEIRRRLLEESRLRHAPEKDGASVWRRFWIDVKIRREVGAGLAREFPPAALYFTAGRIGTRETP